MFFKYYYYIVIIVKGAICRAMNIMIAFAYK